MVERFAHLLIHAAVFLDLVHQHLHLVLERHVLFVQGCIIGDERIQKFIDARHIVTAEHGFFKFFILQFLRRDHIFHPPCLD